MTLAIAKINNRILPLALISSFYSISSHAGDSLTLKYHTSVSTPAAHKESLAYKHNFDSIEGFSLGSQYTYISSPSKKHIHEATIEPSYSFTSESNPKLSFGIKVVFKQVFAGSESFEKMQETLDAYYQYNDLLKFKAEYQRTDDISRSNQSPEQGQNRYALGVSIYPQASQLSYFITALYNQRNRGRPGSGFGGLANWAADVGGSWTINSNHSLTLKYEHKPHKHWHWEDQSTNKDYVEVSWSYKFD